MRQGNVNQLGAVLMRNVVVALAFAVLIWVSSWYVWVATIAYPDFDGALNLNVSQAVLDGQGYGSFYERFTAFPIQTQTNGPLVLPAAVSMALLENEPLAYSAVNLGYVFVLVMVLIALARRLEMPAWAGLLFALLGLQVPGMRDFAMFGYGEVAAVCWALLAVYILLGQLDRPHARWVAWGGFLLGVSFLTKTVSLIWFPSIVLGFLWCSGRGRSWQHVVRLGLALGFGIVLAALLWEVYRLYSLGGIDGYVLWWESQWLEISKQAGVEPGYEDTPSLWAKIALHTQTLASFLSVGVAAMFGGLIAALIAGFWVLRAASLSMRQRYFLLAVASIAALYLLWWIAITPTIMMWLRRIMLGLLFLQLGLASLAVLGLMQRRISVRWAGGCLLLVAAGISASGQLLWQRPDRSTELAGDQAFSQAVSDLPADALLFGSGWWQNPVVALVSGRRMLNEEAWTAPGFDQQAKPGYWVFDRYAMALDEHVRNRFAWRCDCEPVYAGRGGEIFRIHRFFDSPEDSLAEMQRIDASSPGLAEGFAPEPQGGLRWSAAESFVKLDAAMSVAQLLINYRLPAPPGSPGDNLSSLSLRVSAASCESQPVQLSSGNASVLVGLTCESPVDRIQLRLVDPSANADASAQTFWWVREVQIFPALSQAR